MRLRSVTYDDLPFLWLMLYEAGDPDAVERPPVAEFLARDEIARYLDGWGRPDDAGLVAVAADDSPLGAAWYRIFDVNRRGYGWANAATPELSVGVVEEARGQGVGRALLQGLLAHAAGAGFGHVSLSVAKGNETALALYQSLGFIELDDDGHSLTMVAPTATPAGGPRS